MSRLRFEDRFCDFDMQTTNVAHFKSFHAFMHLRCIGEQLSASFNSGDGLSGFEVTFGSTRSPNV